LIPVLVKTPAFVSLKYCGTIVTFLLLLAQCTWTPEVQTPIHNSEKGNVGLQTSSAFKILPQHPLVLSESLIKQILQGVSQIQEQGILQELFFSDPNPSPVFSRTQIEFLTPYLVDAFAKATAEELIIFRSLGNKEGATQVSGTVAVFSPTIFFLTLHNTANYPGNPSKMASSSRNLPKQTSLMFSQKQAMLQPEDAQRLMKISLKDLWIAIDYAALNTVIESEHKVEERRPSAPIAIPQSEKTQPGMNTLQEQLQDLRKKVDDQAEEIRRLQQTAPK